MSAKTKSEITAEIAALEACKTYVPHRTFFGDDNHAKLDLQIEALRGDIDITADEFNDFSSDDQSAIMEAADWMNGDLDEAPSAGWDTFKPKVNAKGEAKS